MTSPRRLELLMQRAADGELTPAQRHELMEAAEAQPDGWKQLACTFLEEQLVRQNFQQNPATATVPEETVVQPRKQPTGFWYHHPALTTVVTICVAFILGLSIPLDRGPVRSQPGGAAVTADAVGTGMLPEGASDETHVHQQMREIVVELSNLLEVLARPESGR